MKKRELWSKIANYSAIAAAIMVILSRFFRKYLEGVMDIIFLMGLIACMLFIVAEIMKFLLKKRN
ncbi:hypothetical protein RYH73_26410 [Olivibacter sp. CPCC 100613]|uniref:hypothetical protein n=1 Tax=Olivibacter sp. CPCC 100613 TaxID=3079931 RepID=UPI002FF94E6F